MKNYLILSGGAFRGAFQLGAVEYLIEQGIVFDKVFGISTGAINGSLIAQGKLDSLHSFWRLVEQNGQEEIFEPLFGNFIDDKLKISFTKLRKVLFRGFFKSLISNHIKENILSNLNTIDGLFNMNPLRNKLLTSIELDGFISDYNFGIVDFSSGKYSLLNHKDFILKEHLVDGIISSGSMPIISQPIESVSTRENEFSYVLDGGVRKSSPISDAIKSIDTEEDVYFYIINCNTGDIDINTSEKSITTLLLRTVEIMMSQMFIQDLELFRLINSIAGQNNNYKKISYSLIEAKNNILGDSLQTNLIPFRYNLGRTIAKSIKLNK